MQMDKRIVWLVVLAGLLRAGHLYGQTLEAQTAPPPARDRIDLAVSYSANPNNLTDGKNILLQGGSAELTGHLPHGFAGVASVTGLHTGATNAGVPQNLLIGVFGPRFTFAVATKAGRPERVAGFVQALIGEVNGFDGVFPNKTGSDSSANGFALKVGGGLDVALKSHLSVRVIQVDFLQTQLPNGTTNVQRSLLIGAGIVWHTARR